MVPAHIGGMNNSAAQTVRMLLVTSAGSATVIDVPVAGPQHVQRLVGGPIAGVGIRADLAFYGHRAAAESEPPNPFIFDIIGAFGAPARMVFGDVVIFAGADDNGNERPLSDALAAVLTELVDGVARRPETVTEITALCNDLRELAIA